MNREGDTYRNVQLNSKTLTENGSVILVVRSEPWAPWRLDTTNWTHDVLILQCPEDESLVGTTLRIDERIMSVVDGGSTSFINDGWRKVSTNG